MSVFLSTHMNAKTLQHMLRKFTKQYFTKKHAKKYAKKINNNRH